MITEPYVKQPWEQETVKFDWSKKVASLVLTGYAISAIDAKVYDSAGTDVTSSMVQSYSYSGTDVFVTFKGGTDGNDYFARVRVTLTKVSQPDQLQEEDLVIQVRQRGY